MHKLKGKVVIITGSGTGIGKEIALSLSKEGAYVAINYSRSRIDAEKTAEEIKKIGKRVMLIQTDVSKEDDVISMMKNVYNNFGRLDMLVNNAGYTEFVPHKDLHSLTEEIWNKTFSVNVMGNYFCSKEAVTYMLKNGGGSIINIVGTAGITGLGSSIAYCACKAAIISLTKSLALSLAPEIQVNAISPGVVENTRWCRGKEDFNEIARKATPMKRLARTTDIAETAVFLFASSHFITGQNIIVDGGRVVH
jgi:3-oxoacyl-[acyl-carrier protein] reductase